MCQGALLESLFFTYPKRMAEKADRQSKGCQNTPGTRNISSSGIEDLCLTATDTMNAKKHSNINVYILTELYAVLNQLEFR